MSDCLTESGEKFNQSGEIFEKILRKKEENIEMIELVLSDWLRG